MFKILYFLYQIFFVYVTYVIITRYWWNPYAWILYLILFFDTLKEIKKYLESQLKKYILHILNKD